MGEAGDGCFIERNGVVHEAIKVVSGKLNGGRPEDALFIVLGRPELKAADNGALDRDCPSVPFHAEAEICCGQSGELVFNRLDIAPARIEAEGAPDESGKAVLKLKDWRLRLYSLCIEVVKD